MNPFLFQISLQSVINLISMHYICSEHIVTKHSSYYDNLMSYFIINSLIKIVGPTLGSSYCYVPFLFSNELSYFCVQNQGLYQCETEDDTFETCNLGKLK
jgi:hypothetical protein